MKLFYIKNIKIIFIISILALSCGTDLPPPPDGGICKNEILPSIWVCNETGMECTEDCFRPGSNSNYCWLLTEDSCFKQELDWQKEYCHLLEEKRICL